MSKNSCQVDAIDTKVYISAETHTNVTAAAMTNLAKNKTSYLETVGNQTGAVAVIGDQTILGDYFGAEWFKNYFQYVCQVACAEYLTDPVNPKYKNNTTYQGILGIVRAKAQPFIELGILSNFSVTTAPFSSLPASAGNTIVIPNAWSADFNRGVSYVTVQGTLYISA